MLSAVIVIIFTTILSFLIIDFLKSRFSFIDKRFLKQLFFYHLFISFIYYLYATFNPSDSQYYYSKVVFNFRGDTWFEYYGTSTIFVEFISYPFIKYLDFSYEAVMALFSFFGFLGYLYFYIFFKENIRFKHTLFGVDLLLIFFFLPNLHFWSSSLGKGAVIFLGVALYFFGIKKFNTRYMAVFVAGVLIYHIRPHIMLVILVSSAIGFVFTSKGVSIPVRTGFIFAAAIAFFFIYQDVLKFVGIDQDEFVTQGMDLTHRATELTKATSGVDIANYNLPFKIFTFLFRPLFIDAPGVLGIVVSFENLFYLLMAIKLLSLKGIRFIWKGNFLIKSAFVSFLTVSLALAQVSGNLGLAIRQKSQIMMLFLFLVISFMDEKKLNIYASLLRRKQRKPHTPFIMRNG